MNDKARHPLAGSVEKPLTIEIKEAVFEWLWNRRGCRQIAPEARVGLSYVVDMVGVTKKSRRPAAICVEVKISKGDLRRDVVSQRDVDAYHAERNLVNDVVKTVSNQIRIECNVKTGIRVHAQNYIGQKNGGELLLTWGQRRGRPYEEIREMQDTIIVSRYYQAMRDKGIKHGPRKKVGKFFDDWFMDHFSEVWVACPPKLVDSIPEETGVGILVYDPQNGKLRQSRAAVKREVNVQALIDTWNREIARVNTQRLAEAAGAYISMDGVFFDSRALEGANQEDLK